MPARCRLMSGMGEVALICDLSTHGCCLATHALYPVVGTRILVKVTGLDAMTGIVRWAVHHRCGVEFDLPLYSPVVDHLCRLHACAAGERKVALIKTRGLTG